LALVINFNKLTSPRQFQYWNIWAGIVSYVSWLTRYRSQGTGFACHDIELTILRFQCNGSWTVEVSRTCRTVGHKVQFPLYYISLYSFWNLKHFLTSQSAASSEIAGRWTFTITILCFSSLTWFWKFWSSSHSYKYYELQKLML
jgi:hypothetical protein